MGALERRHKGSARAPSGERFCGANPEGGHQAELSERPLRGRLPVLRYRPFARSRVTTSAAVSKSEHGRDTGGLRGARGRGLIEDLGRVVVDPMRGSRLSAESGKRMHGLVTVHRRGVDAPCGAGG